VAIASIALAAELGLKIVSGARRRRGKTRKQIPIVKIVAQEKKHDDAGAKWGRNFRL